MLSVVVLRARAQAEEWTKSYTVSGRAQVRVDTNDGAVQIYTGDTKQVEFRVIYDGYEMNKNSAYRFPPGWRQRPDQRARQRPLGLLLGQQSPQYPHRGAHAQGRRPPGRHRRRLGEHAIASTAT